MSSIVQRVFAVAYAIENSGVYHFKGPKMVDYFVKKRVQHRLDLRR